VSLTARASRFIDGSLYLKNTVSKEELEGFKEVLKQNNKELFHKSYPKDGVYQNFVDFSEGMSSIFHFCAENNLFEPLREVIELLIARNREALRPMANIQDKDMRTPIMIAASKDHFETFQLLYIYRLYDPAYKDLSGNNLKNYLKSGTKCLKFYEDENKDRVKKH
jgi:hypothetical protein